MHDGLTLERRSIPTAVVCTEPFIPTAKAMARVQGVPDYPFITLPHPLGSLTRDEVRQRAEAALPGIIELLLAK